MPATPDRRRTPDGPLTPAEQHALVAKYERLAWRIALKVAYRNPGCDPEDLASEVRLGFLAASRKYDPSRGAKFNTYAYRGGLRRAMAFAAAECARGVRVPEYLGFVSFPTANCTFRGRRRDEPDPQPEARPASEAAPVPADWWDRVTACLTPRQRECLLLHYRGGLTLPEVARRLGVSKAAVNDCIARARREMRDALETRRREFAEEASGVA